METWITLPLFAARLLIISPVTHGEGVCVCVRWSACAWAISLRVAGSWCLVTGNLGQWDHRKSIVLLQRFVCPSEQRFRQCPVMHVLCFTFCPISSPAVQAEKHQNSCLTLSHKYRTWGGGARPTQQLWLDPRSAPFPEQGLFEWANKRAKTPLSLIPPQLNIFEPNTHPPPLAERECEHPMRTWIWFQRSHH